MKTWREQAAITIRKVIIETESQDMHLLKARLREAYPFGVRKYHPYRIYLDEVKRQLGLRRTLKRKSPLPELVPPEQGRLFE